MTHASVFSGIGGPEVAATMLGWENLFHCEINPFGRRVLDYWYPNSKSYEDITTTDFTEWRGRVNVLTGGFPCQPFSYAGKRGGAQDDRYLWPYMFRCIDQIRPDWVVAENVAGILTMVEQGEVSEVASAPALFDTFDRVRRYQLRETFTLQRICDDLESHGYAVQPVLVPACGVGAPHRRDRVFIIGHRIATDSDDGTDGRTAGEDEGTGREERLQERHEVRKPDEPNQVRREGEGDAIADTDNVRLHGGDSGTQEGHGQTASGQPETPHGSVDASEPIGRGAGNRQAVGDDSRQGTIGDPSHKSLQGGRLTAGEYINSQSSEWQFGGDCGEGRPGQYECGARWSNFPSVSPVHRGNDGLPFDVDRLTISFGKWRTEALKAYGNAIVPQVMYEIFRAIEQVTHKNSKNNEFKN